MTLLVNASRRQTLFPTNVGGGVIGTYRQRNDETITYCLDYSSWLNDDESLSSATFEASSGAETLVTISGYEIEDDRKLLFQITGGIDDNKYAITVETTTDTDQVKIDVFYVSIGLTDANLNFPAVDSLVSQAQTYRNEAQTAATNAASSATSAAASASSVGASATAAASSATSAAASASTATTKASEASASASSASTSATTATTKASEAATSASNAATSASTATTKASEASTSATNAASSASTATTKATEAATSATAAANSATSANTSANNAASSLASANTAKTAAQTAQAAAESARDQTLAAFDSFDDRYLGAKSSDPSVDNDGNALVGGALYFNSTSGVMKVYTGSAWVAAYVSGDATGSLLAANNLGDLANTASARTNLGLGSAALRSDTYFATAAQVSAIPDPVAMALVFGS